MEGGVMSPYTMIRCSTCGESVPAIAEHHCAKNENIILSLLLIDLGKSTVVQVEKKDPAIKCVLGTYNYDLLEGEIDLVEKPFADIRAAVNKLAESEKPVPRIETRGNGYILIGGTSGERQLLSEGLYNSLTILTQKPLPIYRPQRSEWMQLMEGIGEHAAYDILKLPVWRFQIFE